MKRKWITVAISSALALGGSLAAGAQSPRYGDDFSFRVGHSPEWNLATNEGQCRLRIFVDDKARVQMRGDQIIVATKSGRRSYDQGSVCNQPLPFHHVDDFRVTAEHARGSIFEVTPPDRRNNFTGGLTIDDPQNGGDVYDVVVAWRNPSMGTAPLASNDPFPYFDETRACQDRVRGEFLSRNRELDSYIEFTSAAARDDVAPNRERIRGEGWARNRNESRPITSECVLNDRTNRVITSSYEVRPRGRYSSLQ